ncbi:hypothetical protein ACFQ9X_52430 [Catenulispora yoronensis]
MSDILSLDQAIAAFDRAGRAHLLQAAEEERARVMKEFPLALWHDLPLHRYALGTTPDDGLFGSPFCKVMEYETPTLGSIKGGSASKHIMYLARSGAGAWPDRWRAWSRIGRGRNCGPASTSRSTSSASGILIGWTTCRCSRTGRRW